MSGFFTFKSQHSNNLDINGFYINKEPYFISKNIIPILKYTNTTTTIRKFVKPKDTILFKSLKMQDAYKYNCSPGTILINENGFMNLIDNSIAKNAKTFKKWIINDVIHTLANENKTPIIKLPPPVQTENIHINNEIVEIEQPREPNNMIINQLKINDTIIPIQMREDGYINATQLCKAGGKQLCHYSENLGTKKYLEVLKSVIGLPIVELVQVKKGGTNQGTWVHRKVAIHLAQWISPEFSVQVTNWVDELLISGSVTMGREKTNEQIQDEYKKLFESREKQLVMENESREKQLVTQLMKDNETSVIVCKVDEFSKYNVVSEYDGYPCVYVGYVGKVNGVNNFKFGRSSGMPTREQSHKKTFNQFKLVSLIKCQQYRLAETEFKNYLIESGHLQSIDKQTEVFYVDNDFTLQEALVHLQKIIDKYNNMSTATEDRISELENIIGNKNMELQLKDKDIKINELTNKLELKSELYKNNLEMERMRYELSHMTNKNKLAEINNSKDDFVYIIDMLEEMLRHHTEWCPDNINTIKDRIKRVDKVLELDGVRLKNPYNPRL